MSTQEKKFVLALEAEANGVCKTALSIAGPNGSVLIARTVESALEFAKLYKPTHAVVAQDQTLQDEKFFPLLLLEFSPETEIVILGNEASKAVIARSASAGMNGIPIGTSG